MELFREIHLPKLGDPIVHKKRKPFDFLFSRVPYGILSLRSSDFVDDEPHGFSRHSAQKKGSLSTSFFLGCPMGFEPMTFRTTI